jgi:hypothetical protein
LGSTRVGVVNVDVRDANFSYNAGCEVFRDIV